MSARESSSSHPNAPPLEPSGSLAEWVVLTILFGTVLYLLRATAVLAAERLGSSEALAMARWHVGLTLERAHPFALLVAALATAVGHRLWNRRLASIALCTTLFLVALSGWPIEDPHHVPDLDDRGGRVALLQLAVVALGLATLLHRAIHRMRSARGMLSAGGARSAGGGPSAFASRRVRVPILLFGLAVPATSWAVCRRSPPVHQVRAQVGEFLSEPSAWEVVRSRPGAPPHAGILTPSLDAGIDGAELPCLIMPPPCEVRFTVPAADGVLRLRTSAGVDRRFQWQLEHAPKDASASFEILVNGEPRFSTVIPAHGPEVARAWRHAGGRDGLSLVPGDVVSLRTSLSPPDAQIAGNLNLLTGFGRLELDRSWTRPCQPSSREHPNVVLVVMDTLRVDQLSCYGGAAGATPRLDALAAGGSL